MQGVIIKRHKILKEDRKTPFSIDDFQLGGQATLYGKTVHIVDADPYTRRYLERELGQQVPPPEDYPDSPFEKTKAKTWRPGEPASSCGTRQLGFAACLAPVLDTSVLKAAGCNRAFRRHSV